MGNANKHGSLVCDRSLGRVGHLMPHRVNWSTQQLAEFLGLVSSFNDPAFARRRAVERAAEAFDAEVAALVSRDAIEASIGFPAGAEPRSLTAVASGERQMIEVPGVGTCTAFAATLDDEDSGKLVVARGNGDLDSDELSLLQAMARVLGLTLRMLGSLDTERALREHAERERAEREHAEMNYRRLVERLPAIVYTAYAGENGAWSYVSPQIKSLLGFTPEEWLADPTLWAKQLHHDDRERVLADERAVVAGENTNSPGDYRMIARDGRVIWFSDDAVLLHDEDGKPYWHGVLFDITYRKRAETEVKRQAAQQEAVARLGELALERTPLGELMQRAVADAAAILEVDFGNVLQLKEEEGILVQRAGFGLGDAAQEVIVPAHPAASHAGFTLARGAPVIVEDWQSEQRFNRIPLVDSTGVQTGLAVIIEGSDRPFGVFVLQSTHFRAFSAKDVNFVQSLANVLADAIEREGTEEEIRHQAVHDPLTRLPNRLLFLDRLAHALAQSRRRRSKVAVLFLDLDHFKLINDSLGHAAGDELLTAVAPRLKEALRPGDTVARFGGDEFGVLIEDLSDERDSIAVAEHIGAIFARPFILRGVEHFVTSSIGIAIAHDGNERPQSLIRDADAAMYRAKERGRGRYELFDQVMRARAIERLKLENELRRALGRDELTVYYQPVVSLKTGAIVSLEALVRWNHPGRGLTLPGDFILLAEESGLIESIGRWVLEEACRQAAHWQNARPDAAPVGVSVNLSARQVAQRDLPDILEGIVRSTGIDPASLSLEITESTLVEESEGPVATLKAIRAMGMKLVIDDFGTGYSSLGYLERFPLDALKIDRSFVERLALGQESAAIVNAVIAMAGALSISVVAEGVENEVQLAELRRLECGYAQGNFFSTPLPASDVTKLLGRPYPWVGRLGSGGFRALAGDAPPGAKQTAREFGRYS